MEILYLTCTPHQVHQTFAKSLNSKTKTVPFVRFLIHSNKYKILGKLYLLIAFLYSLFMKVKEDILFIEGAATLFFLPILKLKNKKLKIIYLDGDLTLQVISKRKHTKIINFYLKQIDGIISLSETNKKYASKLLTVPIETAYPFPKEVKEQNFKRKNYALYLGRLSPEKNLSRVIEFSEKSPYIKKLIIYGDGQLRKYVLKKSQNNPKIKYLGNISNVSEPFSKYKFFLHLTETDSYPCTVLEAALCKCYPIISKKIGSSFLFNSRFIITDINDDEEINKKIKWILENEQKAKKLLEQSIKKIPTREQTLINFKEKFQKLLNRIK